MSFRHSDSQEFSTDYPLLVGSTKPVWKYYSHRLRNYPHPHLHPLSEYWADQSTQDQRHSCHRFHTHASRLQNRPPSLQIVSPPQAQVFMGSQQAMRIY